jgi:DNA-binding response OmpR family regulator
MPRMTGKELARRVKALRPRLPVVFMSGYDETIVAHNGIATTSAHFLSKPFTEAELVDSVTRAMSAASGLILVVDDDAAIRQILAQILEGEGFDVTSASDGTGVSAALADRECGLAIVDLSMPNRDGIETIQQLRQEHSGAKIIAISGVFGKSLLNAAHTLGADMTLPKPVDFDVLIASVRKLLDSPGAG